MNNMFLSSNRGRSFPGSSGTHFDPSINVYGPTKIDPVFNQFRAAVLHLELTNAPDLVFRTLFYFSTAPFIVAELIGRILLYPNMERAVLVPIANDLRKQEDRVNLGEVVTLVVSHFLALREIGSLMDVRIPFFLFLVEFLRTPLTRELCLVSK
jgi:hypothetical protein